jgi:hypothetical protein
MQYLTCYDINEKTDRDDYKDWTSHSMCKKFWAVRQNALRSWISWRWRCQFWSFEVLKHCEFRDRSYSFRGTHWVFSPEIGCSVIPRNVGIYLQFHRVLRNRRLTSTSVLLNTTIGRRTDRLDRRTDINSHVYGDRVMGKCTDNTRQLRYNKCFIKTW